MLLDSALGLWGLKKALKVEAFVVLVLIKELDNDRYKY
ncbi:hypothetical protein BMETH_826_0 [methanotrophic bacterial endosymbiont of Bathymodiolus sp.]|nr:hypothetical protein BMETH_826_0 [methanotrophic bacterial endosymbiont of Bathymodiolus sp.]